MSHIKSVQIPTPCHEAWQAMTPVADGRHCQSCCKTVTDFTRMSNDEIISYLLSHTNVCGRFSDTQISYLNNQLQTVSMPVMPRVKGWALLLAIVGSFTFSRLSAQNRTVSVQANADTTRSPKAYMLGKVALVQYRTITGTVVAKDDGTPLPGAAVSVPGYNIGAVVNANGKFSLSVPSTATELYVRYVGFEPFKVAIDGADKQNYTIQMKEAAHSIGEIVVKKQ